MLFPPIIFSHINNHKCISQLMHYLIYTVHNFTTVSPPFLSVPNFLTGSILDLAPLCKWRAYLCPVICKHIFSGLLANEIYDFHISSPVPLMSIITSPKCRLHMCTPTFFVDVCLPNCNIHNTSTIFALLSSYFIYFPFPHRFKPLHMKWSFIRQLFEQEYSTGI